MSVRTSILSFGTILLFATVTAFGAQENRHEPIGRLTGGGDAMQWQVSASGYDRIVLTVLAPNGEVYSRSFPAGKAPTFRLHDIVGSVADGPYSYQLLIVPHVPEAVEKKLAAARAASNELEMTRIQRETGLNTTTVQSGTFSIANGTFVTPSAVEPTASDFEISRVPLGVSTHGRPATPVTDADECIQGSLCVGFDCVCPETFGFDTIKLKENNLRIKFEDTSTAAGFPTTDWQLTANDSASGGANKFSIEDITGATVPVTVEGTTPSNSLYVDSTGRIGFRTNTPALDLHLYTSNTPALRLEQNNTGGFTAQTWDIGANEANFFVRDVTGGSRLPLRIRPGAPTSSIDISATGDVGIGTAAPSQKVEVEENVNENSILLVENPNTGDTAAAVLRAQSDTSTVNFQAHGSGRNVIRFGQDLGSWNEMLAVSGNGLIVGTNTATSLILGTNATARVTIGGSGGVTVNGDFTVSGGVKSFAVPDPRDERNALYYVALEGPEAGTYFRGSSKTVDGEAIIRLPEYFSSITEAERMTVQLTTRGKWGQIYIAESSPEQLVVKVAPGGEDLEFDYFVQGVRRGYLDFRVERPNDLP